MALTIDDNMTRPIERLVWAYGQHLVRKKKTEDLTDEGVHPDMIAMLGSIGDFKDREREMGRVYNAALCLRHEELREYAREYGEVMDEWEGEPLKSWETLVLVALPLIVCRIERKRVGDDAFFEYCPPPEERGVR